MSKIVKFYVFVVASILKPLPYLNKKFIFINLDGKSLSPRSGNKICKHLSFSVEFLESVLTSNGGIIFMFSSKGEGHFLSNVA